MRWLILIFGLEFPAILAFLDCLNREPSDFPEGSGDRRAWLPWLGVAFVLVPVLIGYGIVLGYYWSVVKRNAPRTS
ncbi:MAG TPA: hypothetical protein VHN98_10210 [Acidimicrobiales bacterium]|nr:hypothetical protein [Acidimicrobiales bacterium]